MLCKLVLLGIIILLIGAICVMSGMCLILSIVLRGELVECLLGMLCKGELIGIKILLSEAICVNERDVSMSMFNLFILDPLLFHLGPPNTKQQDYKTNIKSLFVFIKKPLM